MNKVIIKPIKYNILFMPTPDEAAKLFSFPFSPRQRIRRMITIANDAYNLDIKISDRSLDNLSSIGISEKNYSPSSQKLKIK